MTEIELLKLFILESPVPHRKHLEAIEWLNTIVKSYEARLAAAEKSIEKED